MEIKHQEMKRADVFRVSGRIDSSTAAEFQKSLFSAIDRQRHNIIINMEKLTYISSAGIRVLIAAQKATSEHVYLAQVPDHIREVFDLAGLTPLFHFYTSEVEAVGDV